MTDEKNTPKLNLDKLKGYTIPKEVQENIRSAILNMAKIPNLNLHSSNPYKSGLLEPEAPKFKSQEEINEYQSASFLMKALSEEALKWRDSLPEKYSPAILAILNSGLQIHVHNLSQVSFHGIKIEGTLNGAPCSMLAHQSTIQMLCYAEEIVEEKARRPIGFIWGEHEVSV